jgi:predicted transglutaminase-like cysteine proteinase
LPKATGAAANAPVRFFVIREVLAKVDAVRSGPSVSHDKAPASLTASAMADARIGVLQNAREPFGLLSFRAPNAALWAKWHALESRIEADQQAVAACAGDESNCPLAARRFLRIVEAVKSKNGRARLEEANRMINLAVRYASDPIQHGVPDRWSPPLETLAMGRGDCEDYAIAKYMVLKEAGVQADDLQLVLVRDLRAREDHAVLAARDDGRWLILDNRYAAILTEAEVGHFVPLYAVDAAGVRIFARPYLTSALFPEPAIGHVTISHAAWFDTVTSHVQTMAAVQTAAGADASERVAHAQQTISGDVMN